MFERLLEAVHQQDQDDLTSVAPVDFTQDLPTQFSFKDIRDELVSEDGILKESNISLRALWICLKSGKLAEQADQDSEARSEVAQAVAKVILPISKPTSDDEDTPDYAEYHSKGSLGLGVLSLLSSEWNVNLDRQALLSIVPYTNPSDPWTTPSSSQTANACLSTYFHSRSASSLASFITDDILTTILRPLFSKSRPATITASGRKAEFISPSRYDNSSLSSDEAVKKPWKYRDRYAITVFEWAVQHSDQEVLSKNWHMFTPVLLTLLDETQTDIKTRAMRIFNVFWENCPKGLLDKVGLASVFEQAIFPAVLYLPSLTPEDESIRILDAAYPALFQIAGLPFPESSIGEPTKQPEFSEAQGKLLDKIIREGLLVGYQHAGEYIRLTKLFCEKLRSLVNGMGIFAVKHLKDLIPMISTILTDPFATKYPPAMSAATGLLQTILRCCWPRIPVWCNEIIKMLTVSWLSIQDEDSWPAEAPSKEELRSQLSRTAEMLAAVMESDSVDLSDRVAPLIEQEPELRGLFQSTAAA